jgi:4-hydroxy-tetrahydrodipicolinate synthase
MNLNHFPLWTAIITPMQDDGCVDFESFANLLKDQNDANNGVLLLGSTGEALNLDSEEKKDILHFALEQKLNIPLMVGVGGINQKETLNWISYLESLPVHSYLLVTPPYSKPGPVGQTNWFKTLLGACTRPCVLYNVPGRTGTSLSLDSIEELKAHPLFFGIKEASGSTEDFKNYFDKAPGKTLFCGDDALLAEFSKLGARGLISVASNVWPKATRLYVDLALENKLTKEEVELWKNSSEALFLTSNPVPTKVLLKQIGKIKTSNVKPPLSNEEKFDWNKLNTVHAAITNWYYERKEK